MRLRLGLRPIILAHDLVIELLRCPIVVLEFLTRSQVFHRRTRINLNMERHDVSDSDFVPGGVLDNDVQVVPNVHDLSDHGGREGLHYGPQVFRDLAQVALAEEFGRVSRLDVVGLGDGQPQLYLFCGMRFAFFGNFDLSNILFMLCNLAIVSES